MTPVDRLRQMVGAGTDEYTIAATTYWSDRDLQAIVEQHVSSRLVQAPVELYQTVKPTTGNIEHVQGRIPLRGTLDLSSVSVVAFTGRLYDPAEYTATDDGRIVFGVDQLGFGPLASGIGYDLNAAAADVLTSWASAVKLGYDVRTDGTHMYRSQRHAQMLAQAEAFRAQSLLGTVNMVSSADAGRSRQRALLRSFDRLGRWV